MEKFATPDTSGRSAVFQNSLGTVQGAKTFPAFSGPKIETRHVYRADDPGNPGQTPSRQNTTPPYTARVGQVPNDDP